MSYFLSKTRFVIKEEVGNDNSLAINKKNFFLFSAGDIVSILFTKSGYYYLFEGLCLAIRKKSFFSINTVFVLCNILSGVVIELTIFYYQHLAFILRTINSRYQRFLPKKSNLLYLKHKLTKGSRSF